jgi:hypothetical protein
VRPIWLGTCVTRGERGRERGVARM